MPEHAGFALASLPLPGQSRAMQPCLPRKALRLMELATELPAVFEEFAEQRKLSRVGRSG